jgi:DNA-binding PadR family transcriptional regulator
MLEEEGLASESLENSRKVYSVTSEGLECLAANKVRLEELFERIEEAGRALSGAGRRRS